MTHPIYNMTMNMSHNMSLYVTKTLNYVPNLAILPICPISICDIFMNVSQIPLVTENATKLGCKSQ